MNTRTEEDFTDITPVHHVNVHEIAKRDMTDIIENGGKLLQQKTPYCTAVQVLHPRRLKVVKEMVLSEVELEPEACYYSWLVNDKNSPTGKKEVVGATIGLEMSIARNFGNCAIDIEIQETPDSYIFIPAFLDLESGFTFRRAFRQNRVQNIGTKYNPERAEDMRFQIGQSKAIRNVIRNATPKALTNAAIERARDLVRNKISADGIEKTREGVLKSFKNLNIDVETLAEYTGITDPAKWNLDMLESLITIGKAIKNGDTTKAEIFGSHAVVTSASKENTLEPVSESKNPPGVIPETDSATETKRGRPKKEQPPDEFSLAFQNHQMD